METISSIVDPSTIKSKNYTFTKGNIYFDSEIIGVCPFNIVRFPRKIIKIGKISISKSLINKGHYKGVLSALSHYSDTYNVTVAIDSIAFGDAKTRENNSLVSLGFKKNVGANKIKSLNSAFYRLPQKKIVETKSGTYAGIRFSEDTNKALEVLSFQLPNGITDFHTTLLYSRDNLPNYIPQGEIYPIWSVDLDTISLEKWDTEDGNSIAVITYRCPNLESRHKHLTKAHNAKWDYDSYIPHITLSYNIEDFDLSNLDMSALTKIEIVSEYSEPLDEEKY